jgi:hypothetical protein
MVPTSHPAFVRRPNQFGTTDSICNSCLVIVAAASREFELSRAEQRHACDPAMLGDWTLLFNEIQHRPRRRRHRA